MDDKEYNKLLEKALNEIPVDAISKERFEIPKVTGHLRGNNTVVTNIQQVSKDLNREMDQLLKFLLKELATSAKFQGNSLVFNRRIPASSLNEKIKKFADVFVLCKTCGKPDTEIIKERNLTFIKCNACGAKSPLNYSFK
ncbi:MAG: translation initiation factor IF-2 subunit beta [Candidatus Nanoarchaeia archaeon]|nr:translation initiation factor IF-2 subunit beta [Candidatus Nanoarchaeia archaeon]